jgi:hypothetical protein
VRVGERTTDVFDDRQHAIERQAAVRTRLGSDHAVEGLTLEQLHRDEDRAADPVEVEDRRDVRMREALLTRGLALQRDEAIRSLLEVLVQDLDRDERIAVAGLELQYVAAFVDLRHAAFADLLVEDEAVAEPHP